jgi:hypothetical protein
MPAEPQQISGSAMSTISSPGMVPSTWRGWLVTRWAFARWHASW